MSSYEFLLFWKKNCKYCEMMKKLLKEKNIKYDEIEYSKMEFEDYMNNAPKVYPTLLVLKDGDEIYRYEGYDSSMDFSRFAENDKIKKSFDKA